MCSKLTVMSITTCFSSVIAANFEKLLIDRLEFLLPVLQACYFCCLRQNLSRANVLRLSSFGLKFYLNIDFLLLSFIQIDHKAIFKLSQNSAAPNPARKGSQSPSNLTSLNLFRLVSSGMSDIKRINFYSFLMISWKVDIN